MKILTLILLTLSLNAFAGIWPSPSSGGSGDSSATSTNFNANTNLVGSTSSVDKSGNSLSLSGGGDAKVGDITNKAKVKNSGNSDLSNEIEYSSVYEATEAVASSAASISVGLCQNGASGQNKDYGFSFLSDSVYCNILNQAEVERKNAERSLIDSEKEAHYVNAHMLDQMALEYIEDTSTIGKWATNAMYVGQILLVVVLGIAI